MIPLWSIPLATVTGNTLILKPSERDPGAAMIIAELCKRAGAAKPFSSLLFAYLNFDGAFGIGLPDGVLNVVHGTVPTVNRICDHPDIKAISFVGGDKAGRHIYERSVLVSFFVTF
jgi:malonate-semialdehyde dehydrogenase (acetylating)/methylmalonate-semialdehyde dehydrogenase